MTGNAVPAYHTALNRFILRHPRLSVDIDLNYVCALERKEMLEERPRIERAAQTVFTRGGARSAGRRHKESS